MNYFIFYLNAQTVAYKLIEKFTWVLGSILIWFLNEVKGHLCTCETTTRVSDESNIGCLEFRFKSKTALVYVCSYS